MPYTAKHGFLIFLQLVLQHGQCCKELFPACFSSGTATSLSLEGCALWLAAWLSDVCSRCMQAAAQQTQEAQPNVHNAETARKWISAWQSKVLPLLL